MVEGVQVAKFEEVFLNHCRDQSTVVLGPADLAVALENARAAAAGRLQVEMALEGDGGQFVGGVADSEGPAHFIRL